MDDNQELKDALKQLIIAECDKDMEIEEINNDEQLLGPLSKLELDSLDSLQICMAVKKTYGLRIEGAKKARLALKSINVLADCINAGKVG